MEVSPTSPTDRQTYVAYRLTDVTKDQLVKLFEGTRYIAGFETSEKHKYHVHVVMLDDANFSRIDKRIERLRKWLPSQRWSSKNHGKGLSQAISYTVKERSVIKSDDWPDIKYDPWVPQETRPAKKARVEKLGELVLTESNIVKQAIKYRNEHLPGVTELKPVIRHMVYEGPWTACRSLRQGVSALHHQRFMYKSKHPGLKIDDSWLDPHVDSNSHVLHATPYSAAGPTI
jgi:hypothetical protein